MNNWKTKLIDAYRVASLPVRSWQMQQRRKSGTVPVYVVFYHRVSDSISNPWTISCQDFERQISWFEQNFQIVGLDECQRRIESGFNTQPTLAITFDDGYAENSEFALPLLLERRIPITYFVTLGNIVGQTPFAHDSDSGAPLPINSVESIRALDMSGIEIGAHTRNHADIGSLTHSADIVDEVVTASRELADLIDRPIRYFAFPFGQRENLSSEAFRLLKAAGIKGACTTLGGWNNIGGDPFQISRLHGDPSFARMRNWLSYDPRLANVEQFKYDTDSDGAKILDGVSVAASPEDRFPSLVIPNSSPVFGASPAPIE